MLLKNNKMKQAFLQALVSSTLQNHIERMLNPRNIRRVAKNHRDENEKKLLLSPVRKKYWLNLAKTKETE